MPDAQKAGPVVSVLMPVYNELGTAERAIDAVLDTDLGVEKELIVVDDGSSDGTRELLESRSWPDGARLLLHDRNQGKGAAVRTALGEAGGGGSCIFDPALENAPPFLRALVEP